VSDRAARPYQGRVRAGAKGIVPGAGLEPACAGVKARPGCQQPTPDRGAFPQCRPERAAVTGRGRTPVRKASCARRESDPHGPCGPHGPQPCASTIPPRAHGAATRCRPGSPAVRERGRSRARRPSWRPRARTWTLLIQSQACYRITPVSIGTGGATRTPIPQGLSLRPLPLGYARVRRQSLELRSPG
jgi:hypothetical protein